MMKKRSKKRFGTVMMTVGLVLVLAAVCLTAYNFWDEYRAEKAVSDVLSQIDALTEQGTQSVSSEEEVPAYILDPEMAMPTMQLDGGTYIGVMEVPALGMRLPVMAEWSYPNLKIAPCRYTGSAYLGDMVIAGHNYRSHFGSLSRVHTGDEVLFTDADGNQFTYIVAETEIVTPTEIERMITGDWDLTLFTCTYGGRTRLAVRCYAKTEHIE